MAKETTENLPVIGALAFFILGLFQFIRSLINAMYDGRKALQTKCDDQAKEIAKLQLELQKQISLKEKYYEAARLKHLEAAKWRERFIGAATLRKNLKL